MPQHQLTGTRIRERRLTIGMRQADLAARVGISGSYLNLIEHNRRRIASKLIGEIAVALGVDAAVLTEGAEADLVSHLREAWGGLASGIVAEATAEDFAGRFPGWASLLADRHRRVSDLERTVNILTDRLNHDPYLAAALHEMLTTVTAIRSTAGILAETRELEPQWQDRFHRNLDKDAARLAQSARALAGYLEGAADSQSSPASPQEELDIFLARHDYHFFTLENARAPQSVTALLENAPDLQSPAAQSLAQSWLTRYAADAEALSFERLDAVLSEHGPDPWAIARQTGVSLPIVMRRLASLPLTAAHGPFGMVSCDAAGSFTFRRPLPDFPLPRHGAGCPLWPLYAALSRPLTALRATLALAGRPEGWVSVCAVALPDTDDGHAAETPLITAHMLLVPVAARKSVASALIVGQSCRICAKENCSGRREPSILREGI